MALSRRWFLKGAAAAPVAARAAAAKIAAGVAADPSTTVGVLGGGRPSGIVREGPLSMAVAASGGDSHPTTLRRKWEEMLRHFGGLPQWKLDAIREDCRTVYVLDPDIAARHSWSLSVKVQEQRRRNFDLRVRAHLERDFGAREQEVRDKWGLWL